MTTDPSKASELVNRKARCWWLPWFNDGMGYTRYCDKGCHQQQSDDMIGPLPPERVA